MGLSMLCILLTGLVAEREGMWRETEQPILRRKI